MSRSSAVKAEVILGTVVTDVVRDLAELGLGSGRLEGGVGLGPNFGSSRELLNTLVGLEGRLTTTAVGIQLHGTDSSIVVSSSLLPRVKNREGGLLRVEGRREARSRTLRVKSSTRLLPGAFLSAVVDADGQLDEFLEGRGTSNAGKLVLDVILESLVVVVHQGRLGPTGNVDVPAKLSGVVRDRVVLPEGSEGTFSGLLLIRIAKVLLQFSSKGLKVVHPSGRGGAVAWLDEGFEPLEGGSTKVRSGVGDLDVLGDKASRLSMDDEADLTEEGPQLVTLESIEGRRVVDFGRVLGIRDEVELANPEAHAVQVGLAPGLWEGGDLFGVRTMVRTCSRVGVGCWVLGVGWVEGPGVVEG